MAKGNETFEIWWNKAGEKERKDAFDFCDGYISFLQSCKTEREVNAFAIASMKAQGFDDFDELVDFGRGPLLKPGDKVFRSVRGKAVLAAIIGRQPAEGGVNAVAAHIDSPRLDFKPLPLYEDTHLALAKTHYYGGIKKYQWVSIPLALHGVVYRKDGEKVEINIGDKEGDPCFVITDLLPHLAQNQMGKKMSEAIAGEGLNLLLGSLPTAKPDKAAAEENGGKAAFEAEGSTGSNTDAGLPTDEKEADTKEADTKEADTKDAGGSVKANLLRILKESYGIEEHDFVSAEIEAVPALPVRDVGFDRSMIGGYGHDDRGCAYAALQALLAVEGIPEKTVLLYLSDKEEVGSQGNTGAQGAALSNFLAELCAATAENYHDLMVRRCFANSHMLSADVSSAVDPNYKDVQDPLNANYLGKGVALEKYSGSRGKSGGNDADPAFIAGLRQLFDRDEIAWQTGEIGKVDLGGGGTVAVFMANLGMQVVDCGFPVLSMHAPFEVVSKGDIYNTFRAYRVFNQDYR